MKEQRDVFPRDEDGNLLRKKPCQTPGCSWPNWHICLVGKPDLFPYLVRSHAARMSAKTRRSSGDRSDEYRANIREGQLKRWEKYREANRDRDEKVVARYKEGGIGYIALGKELGLSKDRVYKILKTAEAEGRVTIRPRGHTISRGAK